MLNTFFIATIIVAGTNIANKALNMFSITSIAPKPLFPNPLAIIKTAPDRRKGVVSLLATLTSPTSSPIIIKAINHAELWKGPKIPRIIARITPNKNAQPLTMFTSFPFTISTSFYLIIYCKI